MKPFNFAEFLVNREHRYHQSINLLVDSEYVYGSNYWNLEYLDKMKQLGLKLSPHFTEAYHITAPLPVPNQKYSWNIPMYIVEDETKC